MTSLSSTNAAPRTLRKPNIRLAVTHSNTRHSPMHIIAARHTLTLLKRMHICLRTHFTCHSRIIKVASSATGHGLCARRGGNAVYRRQIHPCRSGVKGQAGGAPERLAISGFPAPSMLPTRIVAAVATPNGHATYVNSHRVNNTLCASTSTVPAQHPGPLQHM